ncbi:MAG: carbohydrate ABC transporter permease, partial [Acetobacteraceae bacterium]
ARSAPRLRPRRRRGRVLGAGPLEAALYVLPAAILFAVFILEPIIANLVASFADERGHLGLASYATAISDPVFWVAVKNSLIWIVLSVVLELIVGFLLAVLIELYLRRGRAIFRTLLFLPMVITPSVIAIVFTTLYAPDYGILFGLFNALGLPGDFPALLGTPATATVAIIIVNLWQWSGFFVLMYCVGIAAIDREQLDAAAIDGARGWARLRHIIWPLCHGTTLALVVLGTIQALQQFPLIFLMTQGGPANSSQTLSTYIFQTGFVENRMHYASAIAVVLFVLALFLVAIEYALSGWGITLASRGRRGAG